MSPEAFETALIEKINLIDPLTIPALPYPETPGKYYPENDPGEVLVRYEGRKPKKRDVAGQTVELRMFAEVVVCSRKLRGENGTYEWLQKIFKELEGFTLDGATDSLTMETEGFMDETDGIWQYGQKWSMGTNEFIELTDDYVSQIGDN